MNNYLSAQIQSMENQIASFKNQLAQQQYPTNIQPQSNIQQIVRDELTMLLQQAAPVQNTPVQNPPVPENPMVAEINKFAQSVLTSEQINWISDPVIIGSLPLFFKSEKGKQAIQLVFDEFKSYVNR
jgi:hypothetical protein